MRQLRFSGILGLGLLVLATVMQAQDEPPIRGRAAERLEQWRKVRIMEALKLDEETSIRFFARYNKHVEAMRDIGQQRNGTVDQLQSMVRSGASDADFQRTTERLLKTDDRLTEARAAFLEDIKPILTPRQIAAYIVFERNYRRNIGEVIKEMTQDRRPIR